MSQELNEKDAWFSKQDTESLINTFNWNSRRRLKSAWFLSERERQNHMILEVLAERGVDTDGIVCANLEEEKLYIAKKARKLLPGDRDEATKIVRSKLDSSPEL